MMDALIGLDKEVFLYLNGMHSGFWDVIMFNISNKFLWIPLYALILYWLIKSFKRDAVWIIIAIILLIAISDQLSVHAFKNVFMRLRPCHDPELEGLVHIVNGKCGGEYGFYSSHATNHFALAVFLSFVFRGRLRYFTPFILLWAVLIGYSRIYLGVHFPLDVVAGATAGSLLGVLGYLLLRKVKPDMWHKDTDSTVG
jgi:undecaprenyl-diphosphatase